MYEASVIDHLPSDITIVQGSVSSRLAPGPTARPDVFLRAVHIIQQKLTVLSPDAKYTKAFKFGHWDGKIKFFRRVDNSFLAGFTSRVVEYLTEEGLGTNVVHTTDICTLPEVEPMLHGGVNLRPYQVDAVIYALTHKACILQCPTGAGKTEIGAAIISTLNLPSLWLVHRKELLFQTAERLEKELGQPIGKIGAGEATVENVTVGMIQSLTRIDPQQFWEHWRCLIIDECVHASSNSWYRLACQCTGAVYRFGLSATPLTHNIIKDMKLEGVTGPIHTVSDVQELAGLGFLARPTITFLRPSSFSYLSYNEVRNTVCPDWRKDPRKLSVLGGQLFDTMYSAGIIHNSSRNDMISHYAYLHYRRGEKILILCTRLEHGQVLEEKLKKDCDVIWWINGEESDTFRKEVLRHFQSYTGGAILIASTIFDEGVDIPQIDTLILAGGGESSVKSIQRVGRALRPRPDKLEVQIYDFIDGTDLKEKKDYLANHSKKRSEDYRSAGFTVIYPELTGVE